jgi:hypothetical protein
MDLLLGRRLSAFQVTLRKSTLKKETGEVANVESTVIH